MKVFSYRDVVSYLHTYAIQSAAANRTTYEQAIVEMFDMLAEDIDDEHSMYVEKEEADEAFDKSLDDELKNEAVFNFKTKQDGWLSELSYHYKSYD